MSALAAGDGSRWRGIIPAIGWLQSRDPASFRADLAAGIILVVALFFTTLLRDLPQPVLAAIVLMAVASLVKVKVLQRLWRLHRSEFIVAMAALLGVLGAGLLQGVLVGAVISIALLIRRASTPHVAFRIVEARSTVRDMLRGEGVEEKVARIYRFTMLADAIDAFQSERTAMP